jgi:hypothetical protein
MKVIVELTLQEIIVLQSLMSRAVADAATQAMLSHAELNAYSDRVARVYTVIHQKLIAAGVA